MDRLWLRVRAPFAAYRPMQAGSLRASLPIMPYSAAWGLVLNLAGIETRQGIDLPTTGIDPAAPQLRIVLGLPGSAPGIGSLFQQGHGYPVGQSGKALQSRTHGAKYWIAPVRREVLIGLDLVVGVEAETSVAQRVSAGLSGQGAWSRYGLPFAGDNNLLFDHIDLVAEPPPCRWYVPVNPKDPPRRGAARLSRAIDRSDSSRTESELVCPQVEPSVVPPDESWKWTPRAPANS
ncbi:MAG: CRISPR-associated protein Cas5 [Planctomycetes bacterium]|nr:CRISPR-associated protein Cas5 [Planctomycetota bacterium]